MKKNRQQTLIKAKYEPPQVISLGDLNVANGAPCNQGASAGDKCQQGATAAGGNCQLGSVAQTGNCLSGSSASGNCNGGAAPRY